MPFFIAVYLDYLSLPRMPWVITLDTHDLGITATRPTAGII